MQRTTMQVSLLLSLDVRVYANQSCVGFSATPPSNGDSETVAAHPPYPMPPEGYYPYFYPPPGYVPAPADGQAHPEGAAHPNGAVPTYPYPYPIHPVLTPFPAYPGAAPMQYPPPVVAAPGQGAISSASTTGTASGSGLGSGSAKGDLPQVAGSSDVNGSANMNGGDSTSTTTKNKKRRRKMEASASASAGSDQRALVTVA